MNNPSGSPAKQVNIPTLAVILAGGAALSLLAGRYLPYSIDWETVFRLAALAIGSGRSPYQVDEFFAAPWGLLALIPVAFLEHNIGRGVNFWLTATSYAWIVYRSNTKPLGVAAF